jgi:uncharacterized integral membrane protein
MRFINTLIGMVLLVAVAVGLAVFSYENSAPHTFDIFGYSFYHIPFWVPTVVGVCVGLLLACILLIPGRMRRSWQNYRLRGRAGDLETELATLQRRQLDLEREIERLSGIATRQANEQQSAGGTQALA